MDRIIRRVKAHIGSVDPVMRRGILPALGDRISHRSRARASPGPLNHMAEASAGFAEAAHANRVWKVGADEGADLHQGGVRICHRGGSDCPQSGAETHPARIPETVRAGPVDG